MNSLFSIINASKSYQIEFFIDDIKKLKDGFHRKLLMHGESIRQLGSTPERKAVRKIVDQNHSKSINLYDSVNKLAHSNQIDSIQLDVFLDEYQNKYNSLFLIYKSIEKA